MTTCVRTLPGCQVDLNEENNFNNARIMAIKDDIGLTLQAGKRPDLFWVVFGIIAAGTMIALAIFKNPKKRRR